MPLTTEEHTALRKGIKILLNSVGLDTNYLLKKTGISKYKITLTDADIEKLSNALGHTKDEILQIGKGAEVARPSVDRLIKASSELSHKPTVASVVQDTVSDKKSLPNGVKHVLSENGLTYQWLTVKTELPSEEIRDFLFGAQYRGHETISHLTPQQLEKIYQATTQTKEQLIQMGSHQKPSKMPQAAEFSAHEQRSVRELHLKQGIKNEMFERGMKMPELAGKISLDPMELRQYFPESRQEILNEFAKKNKLRPSTPAIPDDVLNKICHTLDRDKEHFIRRGESHIPNTLQGPGGPDNPIVRRILTVANSQNITRQELASRAGFLSKDEMTSRFYHLSATKPSPQTLEKFAKALNCSVKDLLAKATKGTILTKGIIVTGAAMTALWPMAAYAAVHEAAELTLEAAEKDLKKTTAAQDGARGGIRGFVIFDRVVSAASRQITDGIGEAKDEAFATAARIMPRNLDPEHLDLESLDFVSEAAAATFYGTILQNVPKSLNAGLSALMNETLAANTDVSLMLKKTGSAAYDFMAQMFNQPPTQEGLADVASDWYGIRTHFATTLKDVEARHEVTLQERPLVLIQLHNKLTSRLFETGEFEPGLLQSSLPYSSCLSLSDAKNLVVGLRQDNQKVTAQEQAIAEQTQRHSLATMPPRFQPAVNAEAPSYFDQINEAVKCEINSAIGSTISFSQINQLARTTQSLINDYREAVNSGNINAEQAAQLVSALNQCSFSVESASHVTLARLHESTSQFTQALDAIQLDQSQPHGLLGSALAALHHGEQSVELKRLIPAVAAFLAVRHDDSPLAERLTAFNSPVMQNLAAPLKPVQTDSRSVQQLKRAMDSAMSNHVFKIIYGNTTPTNINLQQQADYIISSALSHGGPIERRPKPYGYDPTLFALSSRAAMPVSLSSGGSLPSYSATGTGLDENLSRLRAARRNVESDAPELQQLLNRVAQQQHVMKEQAPEGPLSSDTPLAELQGETPVHIYSNEQQRATHTSAEIDGVSFRNPPVPSPTTGPSAFFEGHARNGSKGFKAGVSIPLSVVGTVVTAVVSSCTIQ